MAYFEIMGMPQGKARARTFYNPKRGRMQSMTPEKTMLYENFIKHSFLAAEDNEPFFNKEPLAVYITAFFPIPKSTTKKDRELIAQRKLLPTKKPDADNIAKCICDALNGIAYTDDTQIVCLQVNKLFTNDEPKVTVEIFKVGGAENE